jgi:hypothetical protein
MMMMMMMMMMEFPHRFLYNINFTKIRPVGAALTHAGRHGEANGAFRDLSEAA